MFPKSPVDPERLTAEIAGIVVRAVSEHAERSEIIHHRGTESTEKNIAFINYMKFDFPVLSVPLW